MSEQTAYPLCWPAGWPRTNALLRERGAFEGTPDRVRREMIMEIDRIALGRESRTHTIRNSIIISTNAPLRRDGEPMAGRAEPADPGVAVYFKRKGKPVCFACDKYDSIWKNMRAIHKTIEALRGIERWGSSQLLERAFTGFAALPEKTGPTCWDVLSIDPVKIKALVRIFDQEEAIMAAFRVRARTAHPDAGGSNAAFHELTQAKENALAIVRGGAW